MKRSFSTAIALFSIFFGTAQAANEGDSASTPKIQFEQPVFDFGKVKSGEVVKHSFVFTNTGSATLQILEVKPGCGCTTAGAWDKTVEPGKTGSIPLQLNSSGFGGKVTKTATVTCNDPAQSNVVLQITGTIWKPLDLSPTMAMFNFPSEGQTNETKVLRIVSNLDEPVTLSEPVCTNSNFRTELKTVRPGKEFELLVTALAPITNYSIHAPIVIKTSAKEQPEINAAAYVAVLPALSVMPQIFMLPAGPVAANSRHNITIRNNTAKSLALSEPATDVPGATVSLRELQPGRLFTLGLNLPAGFEMKPGQQLHATVKTTDPKRPVLTIPIMQAANPVKQANAAKLVAPPAK